MIKKLLFTAFITILSIYPAIQVHAQNFYLHENGVTVMCPDAEVGETGEVNGVTYTKRARYQMTLENASTTCTSGITDMGFTFASSSFNGDISHWDVSNVTLMDGMFYSSQFNQSIGNWDVSSVTNMREMFQNSQFNQPINNWDVSSVTNMRQLFLGSNFNQPLDNWNVSSVQSMEFIFAKSTFNQPIGIWELSSIINMIGMFWEATEFNQDISDWDVSNVTRIYMQWLFLEASSFNQNLSKWCVENIQTEPINFSIGSPLEEENKPVWGTCPDATSIVTDELSTVFTLQQNYPNPFNPSTIIEFGLPEAANVQLYVYDMLSRRVAVLENGIRTAGKHQISFDASSLSSGMYIYRIKAGEFVETRKMVLVK